MLALVPITRFYTFTATGTVTVQDLLDTTRHLWIGTLTVRAGTSNAGLVTWSDASRRQTGGYLRATEAVTMDFGAGQALATSLIFNGSQNDVAYFTIGVNAYYIGKGIVS